MEEKVSRTNEINRAIDIGNRQALHVPADHVNAGTHFIGFDILICQPRQFRLNFNTGQGDIRMPAGQDQGDNAAARAKIDNSILGTRVYMCGKDHRID